MARSKPMGSACESKNDVMIRAFQPSFVASMPPPPRRIVLVGERLALCKFDVSKKGSHRDT